MTNADPDKIRKVLREEIPEFRGVGSPTSLLGNLVMAVGSIGICSVVGAGAFWLLTEMVESDYEDTTLILVMILSPILGFVVGYLTPDHKDRSVSDYEITNDDGGLGCLLYFLHMLGSGVYHSVSQLFSGFGKDRSKEFELAVSIVSHLLRNQREAPTAKLAESLVDQGVPRERVRETLVLLRGQRVIEPSDDITRISPSLLPRFL